MEISNLQTWKRTITQFDDSTFSINGIQRKIGQFSFYFVTNRSLANIWRSIILQETENRDSLKFNLAIYSLNSTLILKFDIRVGIFPIGAKYRRTVTLLKKRYKILNVRWMKLSFVKRCIYVNTWSYYYIVYIVELHDEVVMWSDEVVFEVESIDRCKYFKLEVSHQNRHRYIASAIV